MAMEVAFDATGLATPLRDGDILRVLSIVPRYQKTVTLRGNTANPGRFAWHQGMKLSELIPDQDSLLTRNYWWKRTQLGLPSPEFEVMRSYPCVRQPNSTVDLPRNQNQRQNPGSASGGYPAADGALPADPLMRGQDDTSGAYQNSTTQQTPQTSLNYGIVRPYYGPDCETYGGQLAPNPYTSDSYKSNQYAMAAQQANSSTGVQQRDGQSQLGTGAGAGSIASRQTEAVTQNTASATEHTTVTLPAPEIDWNYAVIERMDNQTLKTSLIPFDLGKLVMGHDPTQNLELQPGDVVTVFSQADIRVPIEQQTKFVRLDGEVVRSGIYSVLPGESLRQLIIRAGGLTPNAYLYGSEFTRESTRVIQQQRIDEYVQNLQMDISRGSLATTSSGASTAQDLAGATAAATSEHELIARLQQIRATGRVVLEVAPQSKNITDLPDLSLEDGDRFIVPSVPANVNVVGSVYDQNSFVFKQDRRIGDYLHLAGGPNRDADRKHIFLIRADGSVVSRVAANGLWGNNFESLAMNPGDTLVIPEKTFRPTALRNLMDYSQVFTQFALGAAAINVLK
jgi:protein involved in polysaccharide export with SLBB domain